MSRTDLTGLSGVSIRRPVFTTMLMVGLVVLGLFSYRRLPIDQFPNVDIPIVAIQTVYPGASSETIEREVTRRLEEAFNPVAGVDQITSVSLEGVSQITIQFDLGRDVDLASQDVRAKIEGIRRDLPTDIESPVVQKFDPSAQPIISLALASNAQPIDRLTVLASETIRRRLESARGVGEVRIAGGLDREIRVNLLPDRLQALGVTVPDVMKALAQQNMEVPAGRVESGAREQLVRVTGRITDPRQFGDVVVVSRAGQPVRLRDVATVETGTEEERSVALVNDQRAVSLDILKVSGANTVAVADAVKAEIERIRKTLPAGTELRIVRDNSTQIRQSVTDVIHELLLGALLTIIIVMLFLNDWKATAITSLALPVSVISSFILMDVLGFSLNMLTLMALSLSIGILIDDAIVVVENVVRHREKGEDHFTAAANGTSEIFLAVLATTLSIVAVFVPVAFMGGIIGRFFFQFGLTVAWAVLVSLFVSFTLTPMLSAWWGVNPHVHGAGANVVTRTIARFNEWFDRQAHRYRGIIRWALAHRKSTLLLAAASFIGAIMLFPLIGGAFMPETDNSQFTVLFDAPEGSSLAYTRGKGLQILDEVRRIPGVDYTYTTIGSGATGTVKSGSIFVSLTRAADRSKSQLELMADARARLGRIQGVQVQVLEAGGLGGAQAPLQVEIHGPDVQELQDISTRAVALMRKMPGIVDVKSSLGDPKPEFRIKVDRDVANRIGVDIGTIATTIRPLLAGQTATRWEDPSGEERDVVVQVPAAMRASLQDIASIPIATSTKVGGISQLIPLSDIATIESGTAPAQIDRKDLERVATIGANTAGLAISEASTAITTKLSEIKLPPGYSIGLAGQTQQLAETAGYVIQAILLAVILIFLILASQFESFTQPFAIMVSLPLSLVGVLLALLVTRTTMNMMSMIGVIMLMGLVVKNAILVVDNANERRSQGADRDTALIEAGAVRLRPIMMTTLAMIFGMLPIALAMGEGGGFRAPMARAVIGGLITSTMLTLLVVPVVYTYFDGMGAWLKGRFVSRERRREIEKEQADAGFPAQRTSGD
ncbi:MAG: multidrug resistance protein [Gemmatimonadetes bacterium]|nr:multidrug resistance protein [Gemmatimonadota bacterium]